MPLYSSCSSDTLRNRETSLVAILGGQQHLVITAGGIALRNGKFTGCIYLFLCVRAVHLLLYFNKHCVRINVC